MHCPRCGAENQEENRYCVGCGSTLSGLGGSPAVGVSSRQRFRQLIGTTRRARLLSAATALAILVAIGAFLALRPDSESGAVEDAFTRATDRSCLREKRTIAALEEQTLRRSEPDVGAFAGALVSIVAEWRSSLQGASTSSIHSRDVAELNTALINVLIRAGTLARVARDGSPAQVATQAGRVDEASAQVNRAIETLGLKRCASFALVSVGSAGR